MPSDAELEERGAVIGEIHFNIADIFNELDPRENKALYRLANRLHIKTRESAIRAQLLFTTGDRYSARLIAETERALRRLDFLHNATIHAIAYDGQRVDLLVQTRDVWTLQPGFSFERKGGENETSVELEEENLLGYGKGVNVEWSKDVERTAVLLQYSDPNVLQSRWRAQLSYSINDDGRLAPHRTSSGRSFRSTAAGAPVARRSTFRASIRATTWVRSSMSSATTNPSRKFAAAFRTAWRTAGRGAGSRGFATTTTASPSSRSAPPPAVLPPDRKLVYPWVGIALIEDEYRTTQNLDQIGRLEDLYFGTSFSLQLG